MANKIAKFVATLVFFDELHLAVLQAGKMQLVALAIDRGPENEFLAVSVSPQHLHDYLNEVVHLRYLFTTPKRKSLFTCILDRKEGIALLPASLPISNELLPDRGFFARSHTHSFNVEAAPSGQEILDLDGQWELPEFGRFQNLFSDLYSFVAGMRNAFDDLVDGRIRSGIERAFLQKPLRGGSSYGNLFDDLEAFIPLKERLQLKKIQKASPGEMVLRGSSELFDSSQVMIENFLNNREKVTEMYQSLYKLLQKAGLLRTSVSSYNEFNDHTEQIISMSKSLYFSHSLEDFEGLRRLCLFNSLATAKVVLALHRRVEGAAEYFAQGRVSFRQ